ncbi:hypothetical protein SVAN01_03590 [Stagonosporopsis vannaccii]|nr:hypothetical protein SVAN01_03590 [Stagonosporopsis vannaccii]
MLRLAPVSASSEPRNDASGRPPARAGSTVRRCECAMHRLLALPEEHVAPPRAAARPLMRSAGWVCTAASEVIARPALCKGLSELSPRQRLQ